MVKKIKKHLLIVSLALILVSAFLPQKAYAGCALGEPPIDQPLNQLLNLLCPIQVGINVLILSSGAVFVAMIILASIKLSFSQGDIKAIEGAKQTLTWSVIGFVAILGVGLGLNILLGFFGASNYPDLTEGIQGIIKWLEGK